MEIIEKEIIHCYSKEVIFTLDTEGEFCHLNNAWTLLTGHKINDSLQKPLTSFIESEKEIRLIKEFIFNDELNELNLELQVKTSTFTKCVEACFHKIYDSNSCTSIFGTFTDITRSVENNKMLLRQLTVEQENKKKFNDALNLFSHNLSSAQAAVFSSVELLEMMDSSTKQALAKQRKMHYSNIKAQTQNINELLDDFLSTWVSLHSEKDDRTIG